MANEQLRVILTLDSAQYKREARETATATGQIGREAKNVGTATGRMRDMFTRAGPLIKTGFALVAGTAIKNFGEQSKDAFVNLNESLNAVQKTFGPAADGILAIGERSAESFGLSNAAFNQFSVQFSAFAKQIAGQGGDVAGVVEDITGRVSDFASVQNLEVPEAALVIQSALAGETESFRRFGGDVSAAAVQQKALELGLGKTSAELSEQDKILARYNLIMDQTALTAGDFADTIDEYANAQRVANAQTEDQKALIGKALIPAYQAMLPLQVKAAKAVGLLATGLSDLTGQITEAEAAAQRLSILLGEDTSSAEGFLTALVDLNPELDNTSIRAMQAATNTEAFETNLRDLLDASNLTAVEIRKLREADDEFLLSIGFMNHQLPILRDALTEADREQNRLSIANQQARGFADQFADSVEGVGEETEEATSALQRYEDEVRSQFDPMFALRNAVGEVAAAQQAVVDAADEFGVKSPEYADAVVGLAEKAADLEAAERRVADQVVFTRDEYETQLRAMTGLTEPQIDLILAEFERVNGFAFQDKSMLVTVTTRNITGGGIQRQHGGPFQRGQLVQAGEGNRPELMIIPGDAGQIFSHAESKRLINALAGAGSRSTQVGPNYISSQADPDRIGDALMWRLRTAGV